MEVEEMPKRVKVSVSSINRYSVYILASYVPLPHTPPPPFKPMYTCLD
jgi:hypothetical protein